MKKFYANVLVKGYGEVTVSIKSKSFEKAYEELKISYKEVWNLREVKENPKNQKELL